MNIKIPRKSIILVIIVAKTIFTQIKYFKVKKLHKLNILKFHFLSELLLIKINDISDLL